MDKYLKRELKVLQNKIYKALPIYEEENGIEPKVKRKEENSNTRQIKNPLSFADYIDRTVKCIEGLVIGISQDDVNLEDSITNERIIQDLLGIKYNLLSMRFIKDVEYYEVLRQKLFKDLDIVKELINYVESY